jgi:hypothetical protein
VRRTASEKMEIIRSRYIIAWKLSPTMDAGDVKDTLDDAIAITGVDQVKVRHRPRLLNDCSATTAQRMSRASFVTL